MCKRVYAFSTRDVFYMRIHVFLCMCMHVYALHVYAFSTRDILF